MRRPSVPVLLLVAILALSFGLNARNAAHPRSAYQSADERAYGKLAIDLSRDHHYGSKWTRMRQPLHWPPGAPALFAVGHTLFPAASDSRTFDIRSAYWEQAVLTTATTLFAALLVWLLAGPWAAVLAALIVGTYPPLIGATGDQLSEPLGACLLTASFAALAWAVKRAGPWRYVLAGVLFALTILTRADLLPVPFLIAGAAVLLLAIRRRWRRALLTWGLVALAAAVVLAPWTIFVSRKEGHFVPVTKGSAAALFVGTYVPGGGTTIGMKMHLERQLRAEHPEKTRGVKTYKIPAAWALAIFERKHPELSPDAALSREARHNLVHYATTEPVAFARMAVNKAKRMWFFYYRGGGVHYISTAMRVWQVLLVVAGCLGLLAGVIRRRDPVLAAIGLTLAFSTAIHTIVVSQARYNLPLMPVLIAGGVAGWWLALRRRPQAEPQTAPLPAQPPEPVPAA